jgi:hypothetical protein
MNAPRSGCPDQLDSRGAGDRWSLIVIRELMFGNCRHFRELLTRWRGPSTFFRKGSPPTLAGALPTAPSHTTASGGIWGPGGDSNTRPAV